MLFLFYISLISSTARSELTKIVYYDKVLADLTEKKLKNKIQIEDLQINGGSF